jgi:hypothetical protein
MNTQETNVRRYAAPVATVTKQPTMEQVAQLEPQQYIAWIDAGCGGGGEGSGDRQSKIACVRASSVDDVHIEFDCPFCVKRYTNRGALRKHPIRRAHLHGSLNDRSYRVEDRGAHCTEPHPEFTAFAIYITPTTKGSFQ